METLRAYRFELDLSDRERTRLSRAAGLARYVWNWGLAERERDYETRVKPARERGEQVKGLSHYDQINAWNKVKANIAPWSAEHSSKIPEYALEHLDRAYRAWWKGLREGRRVGHPRFKVKGRARESFRVRVGVKVDPSGVVLPRLGRLRIKGKASRVQGEIRYATVSGRAGRWYVSLTVKQEIELSSAPAGEPVGIDIGLRHSITLSTGEVIESPRELRRSLAKLRRAQRAVSRSQRSSQNRRKKVKRVARVHARVANVRSHWLHGVSDRLTREHPVIGHENLNIAGLSRKGTRQGRSWADLGAGELFRQLAYKASWRSVEVVIADRWYPSSQLCSGCGARNEKLSLNERTFRCASCGLVIDRDHNAAINLRPVAAKPAETLNARGGIVSPGSAWQIPSKREPSTTDLRV